jgi:MFS transporter, FSR family, fosmidomycin resistance protein
MSAHERHRTRTLWLTGVLHGFTHLYGVALLPLYLRIQQDLKLTSVEPATLLVTMQGLAYFAPSYLLGVLADRWSRKKLLAVGLAINALGFIALALSPSYPLAMASVIVSGIGGSFYHPAATALIVRLFPEGRGRALGLAGIGAGIGFLFGPLYSGWRAVATGSWRAPVLELGLLGLLAAGLFSWLADEERDPLPAPAPPARHPVSEPLFPSRSLWFFFLGYSLFFSLRDFAGSAMATSSSLFLQNARGFSPKLTGLALSGIFLLSAVSNPLFGRLSDGGRRRWLSFLLVMSAILISAFPHVSGPALVPVVLGFGFFFLASYPVSEAALMESVPDSVRGRVFGLFIMIGGLAGNLSHWLVGDWVEKLGPRAALPASYLPLYAVLSGLALLSLGALPCLGRLRKRKHLGPLRAAPAPLSALHSPDAS